MKATYFDFLKDNPNCSKFEANSDAIEIFNILSVDENIIRMIDFAENGKPALAACVDSVENYFKSSKNPTIDLTDGFTRTVIGRMAKSVLAPFGYEPTKQKDLPKNCNAEYFTSASCYKKTGIPTMQVVKKVETI